MHRTFYDCSCTTVDHVVYTAWWADEKDNACFSVGVQLAPYHSCFARIWAAVKYVFNPHGHYTHWHSTDWADNELTEVLKLKQECERFLVEVQRHKEGGIK